MIGYIYIMENPSLKEGLLKIGFAKDPEKRRRSLSNSSIPEPYEILYKYHVVDMDKAETIAFRLLSKFRYRDNKEFFICSIYDAIDACEIAQRSTNGPSAIKSN